MNIQFLLPGAVRTVITVERLIECFSSNRFICGIMIGYKIRSVKSARCRNPAAWVEDEHLFEEIEC
jgi:hypothetical protein